MKRASAAWKTGGQQLASPGKPLFQTRVSHHSFFIVTDPLFAADLLFADPLFALAPYSRLFADALFRAHERVQTDGSDLRLIRLVVDELEEYITTRTHETGVCSGSWLLITSKSIMKALLAEFIGTFVLVFFGCGCAVLAADKVGYLGVALAFGLSLMAMIYAVGPISGCHVNPAVTLGLTLAGKFSVARLPGYVIVQILGALLAATVLYLIASGGPNFDPATGGFAANGYGTHSPGHYGLLSAFLIELVLTTVFVLVIIGATDVRAPVGFAGVAIGFTLTAIHLVSIPVTNTSVNPARSIGPALFAGQAAIGQLWLFIVAPLLGSVVAAALYALMRTPEPVVQLPARQAYEALTTEQAERVDTVHTERSDS